MVVLLPTPHHNWLPATSPGKHPPFRRSISLRNTESWGTGVPWGATRTLGPGDRRQRQVEKLGTATGNIRCACVDDGRVDEWVSGRWDSRLGSTPRLHVSGQARQCVSVARKHSEAQRSTGAATGQPCRLAFGQPSSCDLASIWHKVRCKAYVSGCAEPARPG